MICNYAKSLLVDGNFTVEMTVKWCCTDCPAQFQHPTFVIEHITLEHLGGTATMIMVSSKIMVVASKD